MSSAIDYQGLVQAAHALGDALGLEPIAPDAIEDAIRDILRKRELLEAAAQGIITEDEAASALLDRVMTWMLDSQSRTHPGLSEYSSFHERTLHALFGEPALRSKASR